MSARSGVLACCVATIVATPPALAQSVRGTLRDSATREPIPGAVLTITDSAGKFLARSTSNAAGHFSVPRFEQSKLLHVVRIGYRPYDAPLAAASDSLLVRMMPIPSMLAAVSASSKRVCPGDKTDVGALELWEQARAALLAGVVAREAQPPRVRLRSFWKTFDPVRHRIVDDSIEYKDLVADKSYVAARPAWAFADEGYMREHPDGEREYFAPDDAILLDPSFAGTHCLRTVTGDATHRSQVGIGFEPVVEGRPDSLVDVSGVLWLDPAKRMLRSLEFHYTNLEGYAKNSGGEIHFAVMPNGTPMIDRWVIHSAILAFDWDRVPDGIRKRPPPRPDRSNVRLLGYQDTGGQVAAVRWEDGTHWGADLPRFTGVVVDTANRRVAGARVWLRNGPDTAVSGVDGTFSLPYTSAGKYVVLASDSTLASLGISRTVPKPIDLLAPGNWDLWLTLYPRADVFYLTCPANSYTPGSGVLVTRVVDARGDPVPQAQVDVETRQAVVVGDTLYRPRHSGGRAGDDGQFIVCGASRDEPMVVRATKDGKSATSEITPWKDEVIALTIVLKPAASSP